MLANGSMSSNQSGEGEIRKNIIEADLVDCMVALPGQLFYSTQIPVCLWFLARDKNNGRFRDRRGETLFIDARKMGMLVDRVHRELTDEELPRSPVPTTPGAATRAQADTRTCLASARRPCSTTSTSTATCSRPAAMLAWRKSEDDGEPFEEKMMRLAETLREQQAEVAKLDAAIAANLEELGYDG